ncbi:protein of unknown function [Methylocaldum szegediense]|uniref:Uncharacterized protein n=1 Tax=Methylocaldum szegediense TaxID=73780 RepID=A0ABM9HYP3_9GAMM|nr:protein of unknown function [Methylocaldum szegediense]
MKRDLIKKGLRQPRRCRRGSDWRGLKRDLIKKGLRPIVSPLISLRLRLKRDLIKKGLRQ